MYPTPPEHLDDLLEDCKKKGAFKPIAYEWYRYVAQITLVSASIDFRSPSITFENISNYGVLIGLLGRMSRLMLTNMKLSSEGLSGESTLIIDRCINESAIILMWLCTKKDDQYFNIFKSKGLFSDLKLKSEIQKNIEARKGNQLPIENRMLKSISHYLSESGINEDQIKSLQSKMPNMRQMMIEIGMDSTHYTVIMNIGSHNLHGTWTALKQNYYGEKDGTVFIKDLNTSNTHINQYIQVAILVIEANIAFFDCVIDSSEEFKSFYTMFKSIKEEVLKIRNLYEKSISVV
ncbi:hypothetical protein Lche_0361 [Legionella cherrii]|uniref:Uncharacterized protein n=1 Tax=Legionella cherrii TaxID=28084 RepID=A0A0W0SHM3_9GAMM|nr:DUF5677 domain-containing protein [Legionella cherrii]KTC82681.1 hypothetical protein Lche_0361 [Legionella cherrii]